MARSNVPKFGNWESQDNVPYTVYFDNARKKRGRQMINPNDPQENPDMFPRTEEPMGRGRSVRPTTPEHKESDHFRQFTNSSAGSFENVGHRTNYNESGCGGRGQRPSLSPRPTGGGSEQSFERSPLQAKLVIMGRGSGSPAREGRTVDGNLGKGVRSRLRPARGDESPDKRAAIPKFGEWLENDPQSAENFTHIFNRVRNERNTGMGNPSATPKHPSYSTNSQPSDEPKKCCFPWW